MSETQTEETRRSEARSPACCPICFVMEGMRERKNRHSGFFSHMLNAQIEVLQAFKSVLDRQIDSLESRRDNQAQPKKATKIEVE